MARPLRIEYPGAVYHVTARGNARAAIFLGDDDRRCFLALFAEAVERRGWACYAYCLMDNHYHLLIETASANLSRGMRHLNGVYTQRFNRAHGRVGHLFQGRYKAILVEKQAYLLELCRYVVLNPVRAGMVAGPGDWVWSSYRETVGARVARRDALVPLSKAWLLGQFADDEGAARTAYRRFVRAGVAEPDRRPWDGLRAGLVLGDDAFLASVRKHLDNAPKETPNAQRHLARPPLAELAEKGGDRGAWMTNAHDHGYTLNEIANTAGLHYSSISKIIKVWRDRNNAKIKT